MGQLGFYCHERFGFEWSTYKMLAKVQEYLLLAILLMELLETLFMVFQKCLASLTRSSKVSDPKIINIIDPRTTLLTSTMIKDPQTGNLFQKGKKTKM